MIIATWSLAAAFAWTPVSADTFRLADAVALARAANPLLAAARLEAAAAAERIAPAGTLPDPDLQLALMNRMFAAPGSTRDPMTMNAVQLTQMLPWPGKLRAERERAAHLAAALDREADETERTLIARVHAVYYQLAFMDRAVAIMQRTRDLLREFLAVAQAMYAVGEGLQQDVFQAQVAVAEMTGDLVAMQAERGAAAAQLNALLGRGATTPIGPLELPPLGGPVAPADSLLRLAEQNRPALAAARERLHAAEAGVRAAERERFPALMIGLQYGARPRYDNMASLMLGLNVPLRPGSKQLPLQREMLALEARARAEALQLASETHAALTEAGARAERSRTLAELFATSILPQARASVEGALAAYRVGRVNFMSVLENQMTVNRYETEQVRQIAAYHAALADIAALTAPAGGAR